MATFAFGKSDDLGKLLLRVAVGGLMLFHGMAKVRLGVDWIENMIVGASYPGFLAYAVFIGEILAPVLIILGYRTRLAAALLAIDMVVAVLMVHRHLLFSIQPMGGGYAIELEVLFFAGALALLIFGGGKYGVSRGTGPWD
jgi:putative oxidoreductase